MYENLKAHLNSILAPRIGFFWPSANNIECIADYTSEINDLVKTNPYLLSAHDIQDYLNDMDNPLWFEDNIEILVRSLTNQPALVKLKYLFIQEYVEYIKEVDDYISTFMIMEKHNGFDQFYKMLTGKLFESSHDYISTIRENFINHFVKKYNLTNLIVSPSLFSIADDNI
jgi:hypothetical protein